MPVVSRNGGTVVMKGGLTTAVSRVSAFRAHGQSVVQLHDNRALA